MSTKSEKFIQERKEYWENLSGIITKIKKRGYKSLSIEEYQNFPNLYRKTCTDSETAKTLKLSPDTVEYINNLVLHTHNILYSSPKKTFRRLKKFCLFDFPQSFLKNIIPIAVIFFLFFGLGTLTFLMIKFNPENAKYVLSKEQIQMFKEMFKDTPEREMYMNIIMAGYYIENNITIAFASLVFGVTYGLFTLWLIYQNAISIGAVAGVVVSSGYGESFFSFVIAHSAFELLGICLAGGAGLALGLSMIMAKEEKRSVVISNKARELVPVIIVSGIFIFIAAFIEGFISATKIPLIIKISISIFSALLIIIYSYRIFIIKIIKQFNHKTNHLTSGIKKILKYIFS